ncbi:rod shape-determining protein MreD [Roseomonas marmotae]|uniref:Rod shape-determining protein MreD n=1 Tax=Roseomonas marmotae TaxID=2768161 RepID=A0ABS3KHY7_9PROT|nr:rod shape-determining protein MreD [Roseomonas marmotae]MBO1076233.1 rod shape-determining protein MreD [Roseomonas marmotae]QTI77883.1 rod shape-determining protein MreD [Roseomonas marmotae]
MSIKGRPEPAPGLLRRLDALARTAFPGVTTALVMVLAAAPVGLPSAMPALALACVFFWSIFRPAAMSPPVCFLLGLLQDLLGFAPLGSGILTLLVVHGLVLRLRRVLARQSFLVVWLSFAGFAAGAAVLGYVLQSALMGRLPPLMPGVVLWALAAGFYPATAALLTRLHKAMQRAEDLA